MIARTLRDEASIGLSDLGDAVSWGEAITLLEQYAGDPSTVFGAELAGWAYPASTRDLLTLIATIANPKASRTVMPWALAKPGHTEKPSTDEVATAEAELEKDFVFTE